MKPRNAGKKKLTEPNRSLSGKSRQQTGLCRQQESGLGDKVTEVDHSERSSDKLRKYMDGEFWNTVQKSHPQIMSLEEKECHNKGMGNIFNKILKERFPSLGRALPTQVQKVYRMTNKQDWEGNPMTYYSQNIKSI